MGYLYITATVLFTVTGQLLLKWRLTQFAPLPEGTAAKCGRVLVLLTDPYVDTSLALAFLGAVAWMLALSKLDLSHAYPFTSTSFLLIMVFSGVLLHEPLTLPKFLGMLLIMLGMGISSRG